MDGIEPTTSRSAVECSTTELHSHRKSTSIVFPNGTFLYIFENKKRRGEVLLVLKTNSRELQIYRP